MNGPRDYTCQNVRQSQQKQVGHIQCFGVARNKSRIHRECALVFKFCDVRGERHYQRGNKTEAAPGGNFEGRGSGIRFPEVTTLPANHPVPSEALRSIVATVTEAHVA